MTQSHDHWTNPGHELQSAYELTTRESKRQDLDEELIEEQEPSSDVQLLLPALYDGGYDSKGIDNATSPGFLQRVFAFMSRSRLLGLPSGQGLGSYGALRRQQSRSSGRSSDVEDDELDDVRVRRGRKGKDSVVLPSISTDSSGSRQPRIQSMSSSQRRNRRRSRGSGLGATFAEHGDTIGASSGLPGGLSFTSETGSEEDEGNEEAIFLDAESDKGSLDDPLDNSSSVSDILLYVDFTSQVFQIIMPILSHVSSHY